MKKVKEVKEIKITSYVIGFLILVYIIGGWVCSVSFLGIAGPLTFLGKITVTVLGCFFLFLLWLSYKVAVREVEEKNKEDDSSMGENVGREKSD